MTGGALGRTRLAWIAAAVLAAACGDSAEPVPGPLGTVYKPTGLAVHRPSGGAPRLVAASSNADLRFDDETGGAVLSIDPAGAATTSGVNIPSFAGDLALVAVGDPASCGAIPGSPEALAVTATRGSDTLNAVAIDASGALSCFRCGLPLAGGALGDPFAVAVACRGGRTFAYVGYLRSQGAMTISEVDLLSGAIRTASLGAGPARSLAYDAERDRLYVLGLATGTPTPLRFVELRDCVLDAPLSAGGCSVGEAVVPGLAPGEAIELRSMALGQTLAAGRRRAFLTGRLYTDAAARGAGGRVDDVGGVLLAVDLVDDALGGVQIENDVTVDIGRGAQDVRVLPSRGALRGDLVAALSVDDASLWIYDDESGGVTPFGRQESGRPVLGLVPFGLAVDPDTAVSTARVYVGSFGESFVTPIDVPLDDPESATTAARITGATP
jgi:hypothetical protein